MKSNNNLKTLMVKNGFQVHDELFDFADIVIKKCINIIRKEDTPEEAISTIKKHFGITYGDE